MSLDELKSETSAMLILNSDQINEAVTILDVLEAVEKAFILQETQNYLMPDRMHVEFDKNVMLLMPALAGAYFGTKLVSFFPDNIMNNEPAIYGSVILNDAKNGKPLAMMNGSAITGLRTGAVGGLAAAYTTPKDLNTLGLIGAGYQGFQQVLFVCTVRNIQTVNIFDPFARNLEKFTQDLKVLLPHIQFRIVRSPEDLLASSELIVTATTSNDPVLPEDKNQLEGKHFIGLGSYKPEMKEYPDALFSLIDNVILDTDHAKNESGDVKKPLEKGLVTHNQLIRLGQVINKDIQVDTSKTTFFKSVGMALLDLLTAEKIYKKALEKGVGTKVEF